MGIASKSRQHLASLQPALQYLAGPLPVQSGMVIPLLTSHNTIRLSFDIEEGMYRVEVEEQ
jgi:hypothetical protein